MVSRVVSVELLLDTCENIWLFAGEVQKTFSALSCGHIHDVISVASEVVFEGLLQLGEHKVSSESFSSL